MTKTNTVERETKKTIANNRSVKTVLSKITGFAGFRNKLIPNLENASIKDFIFVTKELRYSALKVKQRQKTPLELSLYDENLYICKNAQTTFTWRVAALLRKIAIPGHLSEVKLNNYNAHSTSDQLKACCDIISCTGSRTGGSSLVFPALALVRAILLQAVNNSRSFQDS